MFLVGRRRCFIIGTLSSFLLLLRHQHHFSNAFVPTKHQSSTWSYYWASHKRSRLKFAKREPIVTPESVTTSASTYFFASPLEQTSLEQQPETTIRYKKAQSRNLGSQELLMLPRQYALSSEKFAQMNHVMVATLNRTPSLTMLHKAIRTIQQAHPLLRARVQGTGEPEKRIDLFQMVRVGEPDPLRFVANDDQFHVDDILHVVQVASPDALEASWKRAFAKDLDCGDWCQIDAGPLWKLELHTTTIATEANAFSSNNVPCALVFSFNHAISDQSSANRILDQILEVLSTMESGGTSASPIRLMQHDLPVSMEESVLGRDQQWKKAGTSGLSIGTLQYVIGKAAETLKNPVILPEQTTLKHEAASSTNPLVGALSIISGQAAGGIDDATSTRKSTVQFRSLSKDVTSALLHACRAQGVSITHALTAAMTLTLSDFIDRGSFAKSQQQERNYKILESLDMRRFGAKLDNGETVACMAGSMDLMFDSIPDRSGETVRRNPTRQNLEIFWGLAQEGKRQTVKFIESDGPAHAVRVFDFAMTISDLTNLVHLSSKSKSSQGRAYSAGVTNVGVFERQEAFALEQEKASKRRVLSSTHGKYQIRDIFYATPHTLSGCLYPVSCMTVNGLLKLTFHPVSPIVDGATNANFADAFVDLVETVATGKRVAQSANADVAIERTDTALRLPSNLLVWVSMILGGVAVASHWQGWVDFIQSLVVMKGNTPDPTEFWAALNFWIFFAVAHPLLQPILWISEVLHGTPGPQIGGLIPILFAAGNVSVIWAMSSSKQVRDAVNVGLVAAFINHVGAGLDGQAGLGDYNLALDDAYQGKLVKGCPSYDEVRQPSMENFDLNKYQGLWYEAKFHDWTQFKEVYDTTLDIRLTNDGNGWIDDFGVRGPAPEAAPLSWDKSPVANGAHYFLFGRVDPNDSPGILREKGFGVEFPNYIVDIQTDPKTGDYTEAIQFQCLERGGVRVFEGINFMSRNPVMSPAELTAMHQRAERAGMYPYGASPEQMHTVARKLDTAPIDNNWQAMWRAIGLDKVLELLTESIEDGGR